VGHSVISSPFSSHTATHGLEHFRGSSSLGFGTVHNKSVPCQTHIYALDGQFSGRDICAIVATMILFRDTGAIVAISPQDLLS
jgi:hypothetical protein